MNVTQIKLGIILITVAGQIIAILLRFVSRSIIESSKWDK